MIYIGTSGYTYKSWKGAFYPEHLAQTQWMSYYAEHFNTVEINATFYRSFQKKTFENWYNRTSKDFAFTIKGPRTITHLKKLVEIDEELQYFIESSAGLNEKLKIMLWQFPASFACNDHNHEKLEQFLKKLPATMRHVFELRSTTWFDSAIYKLLNKYNAGFVINSTAAFPTTEMITGKLAYIRFHGPDALYASSYSDQQLKEWAVKIKEYDKQSDVYAYFNNDVNGYAIGNAQTLVKFIKEQ